MSFSVHKRGNNLILQHCCVDGCTFGDLPLNKYRKDGPQQEFLSLIKDFRFDFDLLRSANNSRFGF